MRPSGASGSAAQCNDLSAGHGVTLVYFELREMHIDGDQALPVVDHHAVAFAEQTTRDDDFAAIGGGHRSSSAGMEVEALMHALKYAVELALRTKPVGGCSPDRRSKAAGPQTGRRNGLKDFFLEITLLLDALHNFRRRSRELAWHLQRN